MSHDTHRELSELVGVNESKAYRRILEQRKAFLQNEVNKFVRQQLIIEAYAAVKRLDDIDKGMEAVNKRIFDIRKETNNG